MVVILNDRPRHLFFAFKKINICILAYFYGGGGVILVVGV